MNLKKFYKFKIKISKIENFENYFPKMKNYKGWIDISSDSGIVALFCAVFDIKDKKELQKKVLEILNFYKNAPLLRDYFKIEKEKKGFSRFINFLMIREIARKLNTKENKIFDKFNEYLKN